MRALLLASLALPALTRAQDAETVRILRDPWGVPHVLAQSDRAAFYGYGWALAEDQLAAVLSAFWTVQGRRTEIDGRAALGIDRAHRLLRFVATYERAWKRLDPEIRGAAQAFAAGINAYMEAHPDEVPKWAEPVQPTWPLGLGSLVLVLQQVKRANRERGDLCDRLAALSTAPTDEHYAPTGSNAWAIAPRRTKGGSTFLAADPHLPWKHEFRLYEVHLRGKTFEVAGAAFLGVPLPVFCRTAHACWGWTANRPDHADVYRLRLDPEDSERYVWDGGSRGFETERAEFRMPDGGEVVETLRWSVHGPVVAHDVKERQAVAFRIAGLGSYGQPRQGLDMIRAKGLAELERAMGRLQFPHFNLIAADRTGRIGYFWGGRVPRRGKGPDWRRPLDGTSSKTLPNGAPIPFAELPRVVDPEIGFVQNCNNSPEFTTGTATDPKRTEFPEFALWRQDFDTMRAWYTRRRLTAEAAWTRERATALATDRYMIPHATLVPQLREAWTKHGETHRHADRLAPDVERLLAWDGIPELTSSTPTLFVSWVYHLIGGARPRASLVTERPEVTAARATELLDALRKGQRQVKKLAGIPRVPWGLVHVLRKNGRTFPIASGMYPAVSLMNANLDIAAKRKELTCRIGSAYVTLHELSKDGASRTWSILPLGQTDRDDRRYATRMTGLYSRGRLKPLPFTDAQLAAVKTEETVLRVALPAARR